MLKIDAIAKMREGEKITHRFFSPDEWMTIVDNKIVLEDGITCSFEEFFNSRNTPEWDDGYFIVDYKPKYIVIRHDFKIGTITQTYASDKKFCTDKEFLAYLEAEKLPTDFRYPIVGEVIKLTQYVGTEDINKSTFHIVRIY